MVLWYTSEVSVGEMKKLILLEGSFVQYSGDGSQVVKYFA